MLRTNIGYQLEGGEGEEENVGRGGGEGSRVEMAWLERLEGKELKGVQCVQ